MMTFSPFNFDGVYCEGVFFGVKDVTCNMYLSFVKRTLCLVKGKKALHHFYHVAYSTVTTSLPVTVKCM